MKSKVAKKEIILDPVEQAEEWKDAVDREVVGMSEARLNKFYSRDIKAIIHKYHIKER